MTPEELKKFLSFKDIPPLIGAHGLEDALGKSISDAVGIPYELVGDNDDIHMDPLDAGIMKDLAAKLQARIDEELLRPLIHSTCSRALDTRRQAQLRAIMGEDYSEGLTADQLTYLHLAVLS